MPIPILMPALSPTMTEGNLVKWSKNLGDSIKPGDIIAEVETDKATMEIESIDEGKLEKILYEDGSEGISVNSLIAVLSIPEDKDSDIQALISQHTLEEKNNPYDKSPAGMPGIETSLPLMLNQVTQGNIELTDVVKWMCENPAKLYKVKNKGFLKSGYDADITIVDMKKERTILNEEMYSKCGWTAFNGMTTKGWPITTIVNGNIVYENEMINTKFLGKPVLFHE